MTQLHSLASLEGRHPNHNWVFADVAARDAKVVTDSAVGCRCHVTTPLSEWLLINQSGGVGHWLLTALVDMPTGLELDTGYERDGSRIYQQRWRQATPTPAPAEANLITGGIAEPVESGSSAFVTRSGGGSINGLLFPTSFTLAGNTIRLYFYVASNNLIVGVTSSTLQNQLFDATLRYTKT